MKNNINQWALAAIVGVVGFVSIGSSVHPDHVCEYKIIHQVGDEGRTIAALNASGKEGWQLVSVVNVDGSREFYLRRNLGE